MQLSSSVESNFFHVDDLFITVRNRRLRAFNRLVLAFNYHQDSARLAQLYLRCVISIDANARDDLVKMKRRIEREGITSVRHEVKYCVNPYDPSDDYDGMHHQRIRLYRAFSG